MRIGIDAKRAFNNHSGLGVYSRDYIKALQSFFPKENIILFTPKKRIWTSELETITSFWGAIWRSFFIYFDFIKNKINIYHGLVGEMPFWIPRKIKTIVTIHDILFERFPNDYPWIDRKIYSFKAKYACRKADIIVAVSESTKEDLIDFYSVSPNKICVIPYSISLDKLKQYSKPYSKDYIVCVSSFIGRKNQKLLLEAFLNIADKIDLDLIFIGSGKTKKNIESCAKQSIFSNRIKFLSGLSDDEKFAYLTHAKFSVYPSQYEGFGIPILESFLYKTPIVLSDTKIHREVAGDAGIYFKNNDLDSLIDKIKFANSLSASEKDNWANKVNERIEIYSQQNQQATIKVLYIP